MTSCHGCAHVNEATARYCAQCGVRLTATCRQCRAPLQPDQRFCTACGTSCLVGAGGLTGYTPPHLARQALLDQPCLLGEKKHVTVLFCDLVDSTTLASALGPEQMHAFLSQFFECALAEIHRYEGTVNQFLGDGFMAIFGAPASFEDHAARAGLAALSIRDTMVARRAVGGPGWSRARVRIGLNSGEVVVGAIGDDLRRDYTAAGDTTHLAARLQGLAAPDEILCGAAVIEAAGDSMVVAATPPVDLKGISGPVACYRLLDVNPNTTRVVGEHIPFVGRDSELAALAASWHAAVRGAGGIAEVTGEPGVGKSRLVREFRRRLGTAVRVVEAQCIPYGHQRPNVPIVELVTALQASADSGSGPGDGAAPRYLAALCGDADGLASLGGMDPATVRGRTEQALAHLLLRASERSPLLLIIEDLHWADPSSLDFLAALAGAARQTRCLILVTFRSGARLPWTDDAATTLVRLAPLPTVEAQTLLSNLPAADSLAAEVRQHILRRAEGNPFFLEQLVRAATTTGAQVPGNIYDVLGARVDGLAPGDKRLIRAAAVIGRQFSVELLTAIVDAETPVETSLAVLLALGFIEPTGLADTFRFVHALMHDVAYDGMLSGARRQLHTAIAVHLAAEAGDVDACCEEIARHHLEGQSPASALPFLEAATARAIRQHALEAAYGFLKDALRLYDAQEMTSAHLARCVALLLQAFPVFHFLHRHREYAALLERFAPAVESLPSLLGAFLAQRGHRLWVEGRYVEAEATLLRAVAACEREGDTVNAAHAAFMLSWLYANAARYAESEDFGLRSLAHLRETPIPLFVTFANIGLLLTALFQSRWEDARHYGEQAREAGLAAEDDGMASFAGAFLAWLHYEMGNDDQAILEGRRALALAPTQYFRGWAATFMAAAMARAGDTDEAIGVLEQAVNYAEQAGHLSGYALIALLRAEARTHAGQFVLAAREAQSLRALVATMPYPFVAAGALQVQAECARRTGDEARAAALFAAAAAEFDATGCIHRGALSRRAAVNAD